MPAIGILGAGAIGQLLAFQLAAHQPCLIGRQPMPQRFIHQTMQGEQLTPNFDYQQCSTAQSIAHSNQLLESLKSLKLLIVTVKAYQAVNAVQQILPLLAEDCAILLMHNGLGSYLELSQQIGKRALLLGTTSQGALKHQPFHIEHTGAGLTQLGQYSGEAIDQQLIQPLLTSIDNSHWCEDILQALWQKLAVNAVINPLTTIHQCRNGDLAQPQHQTTKRLLLEELIEVATAEGIALEFAATEQRVDQVIALTANNQSSMLQDRLNQRPTEIEAITGFILTQAAKHQLPAPTHAKLYQQVSALS